jgi:tRNA-dihydrouridine synthase
MIGRAALNHPWIFREVRQLMAGTAVRAPAPAERLALCRRHLLHNVAARGERRGVMALRRHLQGYLCGVPGGMALRRALLSDDTLAGNLALIDTHEAAVGSQLPVAG